MRKLVAFLGVIGTGAIYLSATNSGKTKADTPSASVSAMSKNKDIAVVHSLKIKSEYYKVKEFNDALAKNIDAVQKELFSMASDFDRIRKEYQELIDKSENPALTEEAKKKVRGEADDKLGILKQKENAILDFKTNSESRISKMGSEESVKIATVIRQKIGDVAKARGIAFVLDGDNPVVFYATDTLDITDNVIATLNADQPKPVITVASETVPAKK
ncbi:MAG: OmpH family outer membrane protein [Puniceicoccales bacterium]|nr:OmpH family outer membrane protein [Puniceicoccales bacterium]